MFNCDYSITCNTNRSLLFSQNKGMSQIRVWPVCNLFKTVVSAPEVFMLTSNTCLAMKFSVSKSLRPSTLPSAFSRATEWFLFWCKFTFGFTVLRCGFTLTHCRTDWYSSLTAASPPASPKHTAGLGSISHDWWWWWWWWWLFPRVRGFWENVRQFSPRLRPPPHPPFFLKWRLGCAH